MGYRIIQQGLFQQSHDAGLNRGLWEHRGDRVRKARQTVDHCDQDVADAPGPQLVHHLEPELGALGLLDPQPQHLLLALAGDPQRQIHRLVADQPLVPDLDPERIEEHHRIDRIQRTVLPLADLLEHRVGHPADQVRRYLNPVELMQVALDLAHRHAARIQRQDAVVEAVEPALALRNDRRLKAAVAVARNLQVDLAVLGQNRLAGMAVAAVAAATARRIALLVAQVIGQLGAQRSLQKRLLQLLEQPIVAQQVFRRLIIR